jgi:hypothetical protein
LIELLGNSKVFEAFVVSADLNRVVSTLKVISPFLQSSDYGEHLSVVELIISLYRVQCFQQEDDRVQHYLHETAGRELL